MLGRKILVVDDEDYILRVVEHKLTAAGYRVLTAPNGAAALGVARRERPDLLITDLQMPELSGVELLQQLNADAGVRSAPQTPAIILTARSHDLERNHPDNFPTNIRRIVSKPFSPRQLVGLVREILEEAA